MYIFVKDDNNLITGYSVNQVDSSEMASRGITVMIVTNFDTTQVGKTLGKHKVLSTHNGIKSIEIVSYDDNKDSIQRDWANVIARRDHLLSVTDWVNMPDNKLTYHSKFTFLMWRDEIRKVRPVTYIMDNAITRLTYLESNMPTPDYQSYDLAVYYPIRHDDIILAKKDAVYALSKILDDMYVYLIKKPLCLITDNDKLFHLEIDYVRHMNSIEACTSVEEIINVLSEVSDYR